MKTTRYIFSLLLFEVFIPRKFCYLKSIAPMPFIKFRFNLINKFRLSIFRTCAEQLATAFISRIRVYIFLFCFWFYLKCCFIVCWWFFSLLLLLSPQPSPFSTPPLSPLSSSLFIYNTHFHWHTVNACQCLMLSPRA